MMHEGHRQRLKSKFQKQGLDSFEEHEILELLLFYALPRKDTNETAHRLIEHFGSLKGVFEADLHEIEQVEGLGNHSATLIKMMPEIARRYYMSTTGRIRLKTIGDAVSYIKSILFGKPNEELYIFCLDMRYRLIHYEKIAEGSIDSLVAYPRKIVASALRHNASHIILAHNHPTGQPNPSPKDIETTIHVLEAIKPIGVELVDHIICADNQFYSFTAQKLLNRGEQSKAEVYNAQYASWDDDDDE